jgi:hypothetical protein
MPHASIASHDAALQVHQAAFKPYQVDHLLLLVGENPLPSYVAARTLLRAGGTPHLVYSSQTKDQADRLRDLVAKQSPDLKPCQYISLGEYESDGYHIREEVLSAVKDKALEKLGLNYTGGTKPMATHAYHALLKLRPDAVFSYLDPRRLEMCIDREDGDRIRRKINLKLDLEELFQLHHLDFLSIPVSKPKLCDVSAAFVDVHIQQDWQAWKKSGMQLSNLPSKIQAQLKPYADESLATISLEILREKGNFDQNTNAKKWIEHNDWFEHYVLHQVQIVQDRDIHESAASFHIKDLYPKSIKRKKSHNQDDLKKFEIDVAFMRNYQLFAISCCISKTKSTLKQKLFEVYLRARQLGGDEARIALACFSEDSEVLEHEFKVVQDNRRIKVFGREHLIDLASEIKAWIDQNDQEAK